MVHSRSNGTWNEFGAKTVGYRIVGKNNPKVIDVLTLIITTITKAITKTRSRTNPSVVDGRLRPYGRAVSIAPAAATFVFIG